MQEKTITALCDALTSQQLPFVQGEPLAAHTTFRIGGPAVFWCAPQDAEQLRETLRLCRENGVRVYLLGNGSKNAHQHFTGERGSINMVLLKQDTDAICPKQPHSR